MLGTGSRGRMQVFINGRFLGQKLTGVQRYAFETLRALDRVLAAEPTGLTFTVLAPRGVARPSLQVIGFEEIGPLSGHAWEQFVLPLRTRGGWLLSFSATGPILKRSQTVTIHDAAVYAMPNAFSPQFRAWYKLLLPLLVRSTPFAMTVSNFSRDELARYLGADPERLRVSGEGWQHVESSSADPSVIERHGLRPKKYVLAVSSLTPQKNFKLVADALPFLADCEFDVVVAGRMDSRIFGDYDTRALKSLKLLGYVSDDELRALYENAGVFVYPSRYEGFGIPPLEAMALGCPVLASSCASIPEVCGDAARYFDPDDAEGLAALIRRVMLDDRERAALVERGRRRILDHSWEAAARCHLALLEEVLGAQASSDVARVRTLAAAAKM
ncbi:MAG: glycosyltransferase family 4 protein [Myxococcota bacterium]